MGIQRRQRRTLAGGGRVGAGAGQDPGEGRQEAEIPVPDLPLNTPRQGAQAIIRRGLPEGGHRAGAQVGDRLGVLLLRRGEPRHLHQVLLRHPDVRPNDATWCFEQFMYQFVSWEVAAPGEQKIGRERNIPARRRSLTTRRCAPRARARPGQARGAVHHIWSAIWCAPTRRSSRVIAPGEGSRQSPASSRRSRPSWDNDLRGSGWYREGMVGKDVFSGMRAPWGTISSERLLIAVPSLARDQRRAVHGAGAGARRSVLRGSSPTPTFRRRWPGRAADEIRAR